MDGFFEAGEAEKNGGGGNNSAEEVTTPVLRGLHVVGERKSGLIGIGEQFSVCADVSHVLVDYPTSLTLLPSRIYAQQACEDKEPA